jgi:hypothetical protein
LLFLLCLSYLKHFVGGNEYFDLQRDWQGRNVSWFRVINSQGKISFAAGSEDFERQRGCLLDDV